MVRSRSDRHPGSPLANAVAKRVRGDNPPEGSTWFDRAAIIIPVRLRLRLEAKLYRAERSRDRGGVFFNENRPATSIVINRRLFFVCCSLSG
jgi:hypothetical protein